MAQLIPKFPRGPDTIPFWRDIRVLGVLAQVAVLSAVILGLTWLAGNVAVNMLTLGESQFLCRDGTSSFRCAFDFLRLDAQFAISESVIAYDPSDSYGRALLVGALNTIKVGFFGIILATVLGTVTGVARLSSNWLISTVARWYVDIIRNTPLLLQLFFLFFGVILLFPPIRSAVQLFGLPIYFSQRGIDLPRPVLMPSFTAWLVFIVIGLVAGGLLWRYLGRREQELERSTNRLLWVLLAFAAVVIPGWFLAAATAAENQGFLTPATSGLVEFDDLVAQMETLLGVADLADIDDAIAEGTLTVEELQAATLAMCAVTGDKSETNLTAELRRADVPYSVKRNRDLTRSANDYVAGDCELLVAARPELENLVVTNPEVSTSVIVPVREVPLRLSIPRIEGLNFVGGTKLSPNFAAILIGLVIYTGAFIAEIVRAGIQSVPKGQSEAARALGLSEGQRLRLVVLPQALRVIIPPLTSQYLNLVKNSSLAIAVGFPDLWSTAFTTLNQSGRAIQVFLLVMATYLTFSLTISYFLNWYNRRIALVER
jgi:general L-amino acid transport system permease protein